MNKKYTSKVVKLENLVLDKDNPRFAELYNGSDNESDLIEYLLFSESADEIAEAISNANEFYEDRPLWVIKKDDKYIVKDGNRRCAAVKALQTPNKFVLSTSRLEIEELPVLEYHNANDLDTRIRLEHNSSLFKKWGRIAKALEIYRLFASGNSIESLSEIDSNPKDLIKAATFYHEAVKYKGEDFKKLVRDGRGTTGGKTIVFERLFKGRAKCGYNFRRNTNEILVKNKELFESYIKAIVPYLIKNPNTTSRTIDSLGAEKFLDNLKLFGFPPQKEQEDDNTDNQETETQSPNSTNKNNTSSNTSNSNNSDKSKQSNTNSNHSNQDTNNNSSESNQNTNSSNTKNNSSRPRHRVKTRPSLKRKKLPNALKKLIDECYNLDQNNFANAKTALTRVTFECTLKFIVENTNKPNGKPISTANWFNLAYNDKKGNKRPYTDFNYLKNKFTELIIDTSYRKAFESFNLQNMHQIIHNYRVGAIPSDGKGLCDNLIELIEFMLQEESDLYNSLDTSKF